jgi:hypothetical protein
MCVGLACGEKGSVSSHLAPFHSLPTFLLYSDAQFVTLAEHMAKARAICLLSRFPLPLTHVALGRLPPDSPDSYAPTREKSSAIESPRRRSKFDNDAIGFITTLLGGADMHIGLVSVGWEMWAFFQVLSIAFQCLR